MSHKKTTYSRNHILKAQAELESAKQQLQTEFFGINPVIDSVMDAIRSWYLFPELQERPLVINLWGLTGVGKTSLVERLTQLLNLSERYFNYNLSEDSNRVNSLSSTLLTGFSEMERQQALVICLDEIQHAKSKEELGKEIDNHKSQNIWSFIDSGKINHYPSGYKINSLHKGLINYEFLLLNGVRVEKGCITSNIELIKRIDKSYYEQLKFNKRGDKYFFIDSVHITQLQSSLPKLFPDSKSVIQFFSQFNGEECIQELYRLISSLNKPTSLDFSDSLIFVMGNIDEAYKMAGNMNPDLSADEFYRLTQKMNISHIKKALQQRFRNEQIARLGNIHILYPALSKHAYEQIIQRELQKTNEQLKEIIGVNVHFTYLLQQLIYREGVFPTQGTRPLFSSIYKLIKAHIPKLLAYYYEHQIEANHVEIDVKRQHLLCGFYENDVEVSTFSIPLQLDLMKARAAKDEEIKTIVAVHEAGHAVLSIALLHKIPELVLATTVDADAGGLVMSVSDLSYIAKQDVLAQVAVYFGGIMAETLIFGEDRITAGAESDLTQATELVLHLLKRHGFGNRLGAYQNKRMEEDIFSQDEVFYQEAETYLMKAKTLALRTLEEQQVLVLRIAQELQENARLETQELEILVEHYLTKEVLLSLRQKTKRQWYKQQFKARVDALDYRLTKNAEEMLSYQKKII